MRRGLRLNSARMKIPFLRLLAVFVLSLGIAKAQDSSPELPPVPVAPSTPAKKQGTYDFQGDDVVEVLRNLARQAKISTLISSKVSGTITVRLEGKTPLEMIEIICDSKDLTFWQGKNGIYYIITPEERNAQLHILDNEQLPVALARFRKRYYDALIKEGFSKDAALKIVTSEQLPLGPLTLPTAH